MIGFGIVILTIWALGIWLLWWAQSGGRPEISVGWRDRAVAIVWLPLFLILGAIGLFTWVGDTLRRRARNRERRA